MDQDKYDYAVLIGRFEPFHAGHLALCKHALERAESLIVVLGSAGASPSVKNPWDADTRARLIAKSLEAAGRSAPIFIPLRDSAYNFPDWLKRLKAGVAAVAQGGRVAVVGHYRDSTSYYLDHFPEWELIVLGEQEGDVSASQIRKSVFAGEIQAARALLPAPVYDYLREWSLTPSYAELKRDYEAIQALGKSTIPPFTFRFAQPLARSGSAVLITTRGEAPGAGLLGLPEIALDPAAGNDAAGELCLAELRRLGLRPSPEEAATALSSLEIFASPNRDPRGACETLVFPFSLGTEAGSREPEDPRARWFPIDRLPEAEGQFYADQNLIARHFTERNL
jgi:bifunctional NMN adenylyltransferase/nudix hydrolase